MATKSKIEWTEQTWNPVTGCSKVSDGCKNCYAETVFNRQVKNPKLPEYKRRKFTDVRCHEDRLDIPLRRKKPTMYFVNSMSDLFHEDVPIDFIRKIWIGMSQSHFKNGHTFQVLTKRPQRMLDVLTKPPGKGFQRYACKGDVPRPEPGIWLGVSVENQATADERIPILLETPAAIRWVSYEPALETVDFAPWVFKLDWIVCGGESGANARECDLRWLQKAVDQCREAKVPCFVKQLGRRPYMPCPSGETFRGDGGIAYKGRESKGNSGFYRFLNDSKGGDPSEWPESLRVREWPV